MADYRGLNVVVIGNSNILGKLIAMLLPARVATTRPQCDILCLQRRVFGAWLEIRLLR